MKNKKTAVILAGGKNTRMKSKPKALLKYKDKTIIEHIIDAVSDFDEIIIVANEPDKYEMLGYKVVTDIFKNKGPIAGIHSGLINASYNKVLMIACDMPHVNRETANIMYNHNEDYDVLVSYDGVDIHPLFSIYDKRCLSTIESDIESDKLKLLHLLKSFNTVVLDWTKINLNKPVTDLFKNVNSQLDYKRLLDNLEKNKTVISFIESSGVDIEQTVNKLVLAFKNKGYTIGTIKQSNDNIEKKIGVETAIISYKDGYTITRKTNDDVRIKELIKLMPEMDIVLLIGYKTSKYPMIEVVNIETFYKSITETNEVNAKLTDSRECITMNYNDIDLIVEYIESEYILE